MKDGEEWEGRKGDSLYLQLAEQPGSAKIITLTPKKEATTHIHGIIHPLAIAQPSRFVFVCLHPISQLIRLCRWSHVTAFPQLPFQVSTRLSRHENVYTK